MNTLMFRSIMAAGFIVVATALLCGVSLIGFAVQYGRDKDWLWSERLFMGCIGTFCITLGLLLAIILIGWAAS